MKTNLRLILFTVLLIALTTICKILFGADLNWSGFSPIIAIALFSGMIIKEKNMSFLLPLLSLLISDIVIEILHRQGLFDYAGFYSDQWKNYLILLACTLIGWGLRGRSYTSIVAGAFIAPIAFFLISNLNVWMGPYSLYSKDFNGLMDCYIAGLPFYKNALIATLLFLPAIILSYNYIAKQKLDLRLV